MSYKFIVVFLFFGIVFLFFSIIFTEKYLSYIGTMLLTVSFLNILIAIFFGNSNDRSWIHDLLLIISIGVSVVVSEPLGKELINIVNSLVK